MSFLKFRHPLHTNYMRICYPPAALKVSVSVLILSVMQQEGLGLIRERRSRQYFNFPG